MKLITQLYEFFKYAILNMKSEYVALFSVIVTLIIFILNRQSELRYKKYEERKHEYKKLIDFLNLTYTEPIYNIFAKLETSFKISRIIPLLCISLSPPLKISALFFRIERKRYREKEKHL